MLTDRIVRAATSRDRDYKLFDGGGLIDLILPAELLACLRRIEARVRTRLRIGCIRIFVRCFGMRRRRIVAFTTQVRHCRGRCCRRMSGTWRRLRSPRNLVSCCGPLRDTRGRTSSARPCDWRRYCSCDRLNCGRRNGWSFAPRRRSGDPAERMKMEVPHIMPLSTQAIAIFRDLQPATGDGRYVFPSPRSRSRPLSNVALLAALRRMGYEQGTVTLHGFRAAYNHAPYLAERRLLMRGWANYLDTLRAGPR
jgi:hypothetical protein